MSAPAPDARRHAARPDLADIALEGRVNAARFVPGQEREVTAAVADLRHAPGEDQPLDSQAPFGARVSMFEDKDGWSWCQNRQDGYVGYVPSAALAAPGPQATHRVGVARTLLFPRADIKAPPAALLPLNALLAVEAEDGGFLKLAAGRGYVFARHALALASPAQDFVTVAEGFLGTPYLWGGCTSLGIDCSGLVQMALHAAGIACPRDSDMQRDEVGEAWPADTTDLRRGDLICWAGHIGVMCDGRTLLHANAHHMMTVRESLAGAVRRIAASGADILAVKRLPDFAA